MNKNFNFILDKFNQKNFFLNFNRFELLFIKKIIYFE